MHTDRVDTKYLKTIVRGRGHITKSRGIKQILHGPPMLVDKTNFGLVFYNHANFYQF